MDAMEEETKVYSRHGVVDALALSEVEILLSMRNAPPAPSPAKLQHHHQGSAPSTPPPAEKESPSSPPTLSSSSSSLSSSSFLACTQPCKLANCIVCERGVPNIVLKSPTWSTIMRVVFFSLKSSSPDKEFFNLRTDVYNFMQIHWSILCTSKDPSHNWKKQVQDMLSHSKNVFESGSGLYKQNGFWRLKHDEDPWTIDKPQRDRVMKTRAGSEEKKRQSDDERSDASEEDSTPPMKKAKVFQSEEAEPVAPNLESAELRLRNEVEQIKTEIRQLHEKMKQMRDKIAQEQLQSASLPLTQLSAELNEMQSVISNDIVDLQQASKLAAVAAAAAATAPLPHVKVPAARQQESTTTTKSSPLATMVAQFGNPIISVLTSSVLTPICHYVPQGAASS